MKFASSAYLSTKALSIKQVLFRIAFIEMMIELLIMLVLGLITKDMDTLALAFLDPILLVCFSSPLIYLFVIRPFVKAHDEAIVHINHLAHTDPLTKLANRRLLLEHLKVMVANKAHRDEHGAVLLIDLDDFKPVNDGYGHDAGDVVLVSVAERLARCVRSEDVVGRLGGDEYVILLCDLGADEVAARKLAQLVSHKVIKEVSKPVKVEGHVIQIGASIGVRLFCAGHADVEKLIADADEAMYIAKVNGKNRTEFYFA
jgi:two-component system, cell cycle response regulator